MNIVLYRCLLAAFTVGLGLRAPGLRSVAEVPPLRTLIVSGGPEPLYNQASIESNVRYVDKLLPKEGTLRVLFANGNPNEDTVQYETSDAQKVAYRKPNLPRMDGPSFLTNVKSELSKLATEAEAKPKVPVFLYFTGHGSVHPTADAPMSQFDLWNKQEMTVTDLASSLEAFPRETPITFVMVQCHSGGFADLLFKQGEPNGQLSDRNICGFAASVIPRPAAGCTPAVNEAYYRDFSSYFFAALMGVDRLGRPVSGADYNHNGKIGMDEAFAYALIHDDSIDTPVCTSDDFVRRFVKISDDEIFATPFKSVLEWATPAQKAALEALSTKLSLQTEDRLSMAFARLNGINIQSEDSSDVMDIRFVRLAKTIVLSRRLETTGTPELKQRFAELLKAERGNPLKP